jgi:hypothetical protein
MDSNYALIENGVVSNTIVWDGNTADWTPPTGYTAILIPDGEPVSIGWTYANGAFSAPA